MLPPRLAPVAFALVLSCLMSLLVAGVATLRNLGPVEGFLGLWLEAWLSSWVIAFPVVLVVAPLARKCVAALVRSDADAPR
ncbi:DUF2798 domain-containing protein [Stappia sp.]|uniref:DUF2798 domain-containing protein n=1 Tax=Stappia sp. TaxID=1870903 RepID=UPI0032D8B76F